MLKSFSVKISLIHSIFSTAKSSSRSYDFSAGVVSWFSFTSVSLRDGYSKAALKSRSLVCQVSIADGEPFFFISPSCFAKWCERCSVFGTTENPTIIVVILFLGLNAATGNDPSPSFHGSLSLESSLQEDERPRQPFDSGQLIGWLIETGFYVGGKKEKRSRAAVFQDMWIIPDKTPQGQGSIVVP